MKYTVEIVNKLVEDYKAGITVEDIAAGLGVPNRSVIAKLSSLGIYKRKEYLNKRGEVPIKKEEYIERIADLLDINLDLLESLEKVTKTALMLIEKQVREIKKQ
jgi:hypothetical protein